MRLVLSSVALLLLTGFATERPPSDYGGGAQDNDADDCMHAQGDAKLTACTRVIESGRWQDTNLARAYGNRGIAKQAKGDLDGAIADYDRAIELDPKFAHAYKTAATQNRPRATSTGP